MVRLKSAKTKVCIDCQGEYVPSGCNQKRCDACGYRKYISTRHGKPTGKFTKCEEDDCDILVEGTQARKTRYCFHHGLIHWKQSTRESKTVKYQRAYRCTRAIRALLLRRCGPSYRSRVLQEMTTARFGRAATAILQGHAYIIPPPESIYALPITVDPQTDIPPDGSVDDNAWRPEYQTVKERVA